MLNESDYKTLYPIVKGFVIKYECGNNPDKLDDDIFHETCFRCLKKMRGKPEWIGVSFEVIERYICKSYRINVIREKMYFRNQKEKSCSDFYENFSNSNDDTSSNFDSIFKVREIITEKFGEELYNLYAQHVFQNESIRKLEEESGMKNLKYKFNKIKDFLKNNPTVKELFNKE